MTPAEKNAILGFLDLSADYVRDGYTRRDSHRDEAPALPLAYMVEEDDFEEGYDMGSDEPEVSLAAIAAEISRCKSCGLCETRTLGVPGEGVSRPLVMVIGEGPGADEDRAGRPFVGRAGQLLDRMLESIGLSRTANCFIANMVKCRPPGNRDPGPAEIAACYPWLARQIAVLEPKIILCLGRCAAQGLLKTSLGITALRGNFAELKLNPSPELNLNSEKSFPLLPTFHPSAVLRDENLKRPAWEDLKLLRAKLEDLGLL